MKTIILLSLILCACSTHYTHSNKPQSEFINDWNVCEAETKHEPDYLDYYVEKCVRERGWELTRK